MVFQYSIQIDSKERIDFTQRSQMLTFFFNHFYNAFIKEIAVPDYYNNTCNIAGCRRTHVLRNLDVYRFADVIDDFRINCF